MPASLMTVPRQSKNARDCLTVEGRNAVMPPMKKAAIRSLLLFGLILIPGVLGWLVQQPWLIPSLGPSSYLHVARPGRPSARVYNTFAGHLIGAVCGYLMVFATGSVDTPPWMVGQTLEFSRALASALAVGLTLFVQTALKARHAPAASTTLLITLGGFQATWHDAGVLFAGLLIVTLAGETARKMILKRDTVTDTPD